MSDNLRDKIARALADSDRGNSHGRTHIEYYDPQVDAVLAVLEPEFRATKAEAWDEGAKWAVVETIGYTPEQAESGFLTPGDNPYHQEATDE